MPEGSGVRVKICGLSEPEDIAAAAEAGAAYVGFVFFPPSPRHLDIDEAMALAKAVPKGVRKVALVVDADDDTLDAIRAMVPIDLWQLHGKETPGRVAEVRARTGLPVMKAVGVRDAADFAAVDIYARAADQLLIDAKPPAGSDLPGGNGLTFDWSLLAGRSWDVPWMLAGGLTPKTVAEAVAATGAKEVDVSSGVERARGIKDRAMIEAFVAAASAAL